MTTEKRTNSPPFASQLRTQVCLSYLLMQSGYSRDQLYDPITKKFIRPGLARKWRRSEHAMTKGLLEDIVKENKNFELAPKIFDFPLFGLLDDCRLSKLEISNLLRGWYVGNWDESSSWVFPRDTFLNQCGLENTNLSPISSMKNARALCERKDIYAFTALAAMLKMGENEEAKRFDIVRPEVRTPLKALYSVLPHLASNSLFGPHIGLLLNCVKSAQYRNFGLLGYPYLYFDLPQITKKIRTNLEPYPKDLERFSANSY